MRVRVRSSVGQEDRADEVALVLVGYEALGHEVQKEREQRDDGEDEEPRDEAACEREVHVARLGLQMELSVGVFGAVQGAFRIG